MKKLSKSIRKEYKCPHLFYDDLKKIIEILQEAKVESIEIKTDDYEYTDLTEVKKEDIKSKNELEIKGHNPYFSLELSKHSATFYVGNSDIISSGIFKKIDEIIKKRERKILWFFTSSALYGSFLGVGLVLSSVVKKGNIVLFILALSILLLGVILSFFGLFFQMKHYSKIDFFERNKLPSFFIRSKDWFVPLLTGIIGTIIGSVIASIIIYKFLR